MAHVMNPDIDPFAQNLGDRLRKARESAGFSLVAFERITGITRKTLAKHEAAADVPKKIVAAYVTGTGYPEALIRGRYSFDPDPGGNIVQFPRRSKVLDVQKAQFIYTARAIPACEAA